MSRDSLRHQFALESQTFWEQFGNYCPLTYSVNISLQYKYIYVETPKVACSTIKLTLQRLELNNTSFNREDFQDIHVREFSPLLSPKQVASFPMLVQDNRFFKFCFVRNPYDRLLSCYLDKISSGSHQKKKVLKALGYNEADLTRTVSFEQFVEVVAQQSVEEMDNHWRLQCAQVMADVIPYDFIGRFENFVEDFTFVGQQLCPEFDSYYVESRPHETAACSKRDAHYTPKLKRMIAEIYARDFCRFGYDI